MASSFVLRGSGRWASAMADLEMVRVASARAALFRARLSRSPASVRMLQDVKEARARAEIERLNAQSRKQRRKKRKKTKKKKKRRRKKG